MALARALSAPAPCARADPAPAPSAGGYDVPDWDFGLTTRDRRPKPALAALRAAYAEAPFPESLRVISTGNRGLSSEVVIADHFAAAPWRGGTDEAGEQAEPAVILGEDVWIGARATLLKGARIGAGAIVGAAAVVDFEVPPLAIVAGNPARIVGRAEERPRA